MHIALIQCPLWGTFDPPVALAQLSSCLKREGHRVSVFDLNIKLYLKRSPEYTNVWAWEQSDFWYKPELVKEYCAKNVADINYHIEQILKEDVQLIGFSVNIASLYMSLEMARQIKTRSKNTTIIFGGPLFLRRSFIVDLLRDYDFIDIIVTGEGEDALCQVAEHIGSARDIPQVKGIAFRHNGEIQVNEPSVPVDLDALPFLDFSDMSLADYDDPHHIVLMMSRGCIRRCHFCSDAPCWPGFRMMKGERIFQEIAHRKRDNPALGHIDFMDLAFNGDMQSLIDFASLMVRENLNIHWNANMVIRPELTGEVIENLVRAGCEHVIFGIESGSEQVLKAMNKHYSMADADRIIQQMHKAGIYVTANFMFGFPGETEDDSQQSLDFLKRNAPYLDRCYPSRTYFALEEFSFVHSHLDKFGIKPNPPNHLFWESMDGTNTYPVRMERCRRFCSLALELGIEVGKGVQTDVSQDEWFNLAHYYETRSDWPRAIEYYMRYHACDPFSATVNSKLLEYEQKVDSHAINVNDELTAQLSSVCAMIHSARASSQNMQVSRLAREASLAFLKTQLRNIRRAIAEKRSTAMTYIDAAERTIGFMENTTSWDKEDVHREYAQTLQFLSTENTRLNDEEFETRQTFLSSFPQTFFLQFSGPCNSACVFCSRGHHYPLFNLEDFKRSIESLIAKYLGLATQFVLTGSGEFLRLSNWRQILEYIDTRYPQAEKMFSTNSSSLRPEVVDALVAHKSRYAIHASLHASNSSLHRIMTRMDNFDVIIEQIKYLLQKRQKHNNIRIDLFFVATTLNIEDLPEFVRFAKNLGVDSVIVNYNYIYVPAQKYLSCYFKPEMTNRVFDEAKAVAREINIPIALPPQFNSSAYATPGICRELWSQIMFNDQGHVLPCDASHDCHLRLREARSFSDIWNSPYYVNMRRELVETRRSACFEHCHRVNPATVNIFASHVIHRGREGCAIDELWEDNF